MESPASDDVEKYDDTSSSSSSAASTSVHKAKYVAFEPVYAVTVTEPVKNGDIVRYSVRTTKQTDETEFSVTRHYHDFEYLHHCLLTENPNDGIIMPPLPVRPVVDPREAEMKSKKQLGLTSKTLIGDELHKDCRQLEKYLQLVVAHEVIGRSSCLKEFLLEKQAAVGAAVKPGIFGKLWSATEVARKANHADIDDYFQKVRDAANSHAAGIQQSSNAFNHVVHCQQRVGVAYSDISTALSSCTTSDSDTDQRQLDADRLLLKLSEAVDNAKHGLDAEIFSDENTLGFWLDLYARYSQNVKEMLFKRTCLLINYEDANRALDKAKPAKKSALEQAKLSAETALENCSELARRQLGSYDKQRVSSLHDAICEFAEAKIKTAQDTYTSLQLSLDYVKQLGEL